MNLSLHVVGQRDNGYHLLDSLVVFIKVGDRVSLEAGAEPATIPSVTLTRKGPFSYLLGATEGDLVTRAAFEFATAAAAAGRPLPALALDLAKNLPVASGIGGGSSDAAATLRLLDGRFPGAVTPGTLQQIALRLGADVPMCLAARPARVGGIGEIVTPYGGLPAFHMVLVNPGKGVSTPDVFRRLMIKTNPPLPELPDRFAGLDTLLDWLSETRNDLQAPAMAIVPEIGDALGALRSQPGCLFARMSGSGATVFGLFADANEAARAGGRLFEQHRGWWVAAGGLFDAQEA